MAGSATFRAAGAVGVTEAVTATKTPQVATVVGTTAVLGTEKTKK